MQYIYRVAFFDEEIVMRYRFFPTEEGAKAAGHSYCDSEPDIRTVRMDRSEFPITKLGVIALLNKWGSSRV